MWVSFKYCKNFKCQVWNICIYCTQKKSSIGHHNRGPRNETLEWIRARFFRSSSRGNSVVATGRGTNVRWALKSWNPPPLYFSQLRVLYFSHLAGERVYNFTVSTADTIQLQSTRGKMMDEDLCGTNPNFCQFYLPTRPQIYFSSDSPGSFSPNCDS